MDSVLTEVHTCFHCGNTGVLRHIGSTAWEDADIQKNPHGDIIGYSIIEHENWHVFECPVCHKPVVISEYFFDAAQLEPEYKTEYPSISVSEIGVPKEIYSAFVSAVKTKGIDSAICLLSLRRVLELICKENNAQGKSLEDKIESLVKDKILPSMISDACTVIRRLGNAGAHADSITIYQAEIDQIIGYVATIIDYLYSLPRRIEIMKDRLSERGIST